MPGVEGSVVCRAPAVEVWKLLHDPGRIPQWWAGVRRASPGRDGALLYPDAFPGSAVPTRFTSGAGGRQLRIDCLLTRDVYVWTLEPHPDGCRVHVGVTVADGDEQRARYRRGEVQASLARLARAAEQACRPPRPGGPPPSPG